MAVSASTRAMHVRVDDVRVVAYEVLEDRAACGGREAFHLPGSLAVDLLRLVVEPAKNAFVLNFSYVCPEPVLVK